MELIQVIKIDTYIYIHVFAPIVHPVLTHRLCMSGINQP